MFSCRSTHEKTDTSTHAESYAASTRSFLKPYQKPTSLHVRDYNETPQLSAIWPQVHIPPQPCESAVQICLNPAGLQMKDAILEFPGFSSKVVLHAFCLRQEIYEEDERAIAEEGDQPGNKRRGWMLGSNNFAEWKRGFEARGEEQCRSRGRRLAAAARCPPRGETGLASGVVLGLGWTGTHVPSEVPNARPLNGLKYLGYLWWAPPLASFCNKTSKWAKTPPLESIKNSSLSLGLRMWCCKK